ncbi:meso-butanediol dehydrogenase / (S,S)-butanediol dehydrogenase / diacetyl reductase [Shimia gijangensis]|uniref:Meso-butanediol dehydrogenase / (S,S)-butanediol dehydrogenase / diacetyl reductase n=1 Tax=Shimia gijangensis TaxID=1470563 RepID=A0A1M6N8U0_9RHOB|nr:SDR family NAD(P)-dependent oxidoreductase [Shimia gijangensis]SHJ92138.1 meso-butanediol dehydrogenase / (S,S)-butanediol dehydrogenase / diacetyl reductase [Shimia gijangensis]
MMRFTEKVVLITGGNSGIGLAIAERFAREGAHMILVGRDPGKGSAAVAKIKDLGAESEFLQIDLSSEAAVRDAVGQLGKLDVLVNNAGLGTRRTAVNPDDTPGIRWDRWRGANLDATYYMTAYCLPLLKKSGGNVINISSTAAMHGNWGLYGVSKAGVEALTRSFATEAAPVRVNAISPGWISTDATVHASGNADGSWELPPSLLGRVGTGAEIAGAVTFLASEDASFVTGQTLIVDGGLTTMDFPSRTLLNDVGNDLFSGG